MSAKVGAVETRNKILGMLLVWRAIPKKGDCPANGQSCTNWGKFDHYAKVCRSERVSKPHMQHVTPKPYQRRKQWAKQTVRRLLPQTDSDSNDEYIYSVNNEQQRTQPWTRVIMSGTEVMVLIDTGSTVNVSDSYTTRACSKFPH